MLSVDDYISAYPGKGSPLRSDPPGAAFAAALTEAPALLLRLKAQAREKSALRERKNNARNPIRTTCLT